MIKSFCKYFAFLIFTFGYWGVNTSSAQDVLQIPHSLVFVGDELTITGNAMLSVTGAKLNQNSISTQLLNFVSDNEARFVLPNSIKKGSYELVLFRGTTAGNNLSFTVTGPLILAVEPQAFEIDDVITITTQRLDSVVHIKVGNANADLKTVSLIDGTKKFSFKVPALNSLGEKSLFISGIYDQTDTVEVSVTGLNTPLIDNISPAAARPGNRVTISGKNFESITGVAFGNTAASLGSIFFINNDTFYMNVPETVKGTIFVTVYTSRGESNFFTFNIIGNLPTINDFSPKEASVGDEITVSGSGLSLISAVVLNGVTIAGIQKFSPESFSFIIPNEAQSGIPTAIIDGQSFDMKSVLSVNTVTSIRNNVVSIDPNMLTVVRYDEYTYALAAKKHFNNVLQIEIYDMLGRKSLDRQIFLGEKFVMKECSILIIKNQKVEEEGIYRIKLCP